MTLNLALALSAVLSTVYAVFLARSDFGLWLRQEMTWLTVVVGVGMTLGGIALVDAAAAGLAVWFFVAGGAPIVVRSLWLTGSHLVAWLEYRTRKAGDE